MKAIITGGTGMTGSLILAHCLKSADISEVVSLVRQPTGSTHQKLTEVVVQNFEDYSSHDSLFKGADMAFFFIGVYTGQVDDDIFRKISVNYAFQFALALKEHSPKATLCLLSGAGADRTEKSSAAFARYKGMAENQIEALKLNFYTFRPGYIYPVTPREEPNIMYRISRALYPLIRMLGQNSSIKSTELAEAMFRVARKGADKCILENKDILAQLKKP
jgi:uncharacterized protein YbjT (DUF2867 family)